MAEKVTLTRINIFDSAKTFKDNEAQITDNELNLIKCGAVVTETWKSEDGSHWYRVWSDGFIEQGGINTEVNSQKVTFMKAFSKAPSNIEITMKDWVWNSVFGPQWILAKEVTNKSFSFGAALSQDQINEKLSRYWKASGY